MNRRRRLLKRAIITLVLVTVIYHVAVFLFSHFYLRNRITTALEENLGGKAELRFAWTDLYRNFGLRGLTLQHGDTVTIQLARLDLEATPDFFTTESGKVQYLLYGTRGHVNLAELNPRLYRLQTSSPAGLLDPAIEIRLRAIRLVLPTAGKQPVIFPQAALDWQQAAGRFRGHLQTAFLLGRKFPTDVTFQGNAREATGEVVAGPGRVSLPAPDGLPARISGEVSLIGNFRWNQQNSGPVISDWVAATHWQNTKLQLGPLSFDDLSGEIRASIAGSVLARLSNGRSRLEADILAGEDFRDTVSVRFAFAGRHRYLPDLDLTGSWNGRIFKCDALNLQSGQGTARLTGEINPGGTTYAVNLQARKVDLRSLLPLLRGQVPFTVDQGILDSADLNLNGTFFGLPCPEGKVILRDLHAAGLQLSEAELNLRVEKDTVRLKDSHLRMKSGEQCQISGSFCVSGTASAELEVKKLLLPARTLSSLLPGLNGSASVNGKLQISGTQLSFLGDFRGNNLNINGFPIFPEARVDMTGQLVKGKLVLAGLTLSQGDERLIIKPSGAGFTIQGKLAGPPLTRWLKEQIPGRGLNVSRVEFDLRTQTGKLPSGSVKFVSLNGREGGLPWKIPSGTLHFSSDSIEARGIQLETVGSSLNGTLKYQVTRQELDFQFKGKLPDGSELLRRVQPELQASGVAADLDLSGQVRLTDGKVNNLKGSFTIVAQRVKSPFLTDALEQLNCRLEADGRQLIVRTGRFLIGGMEWKISGGWNLKNGFPGVLDISAGCEQAAWKVPKLVEVKGSAAFHVGGTALAPKLEGNVDVKEGILELPREMTAAPALQSGGIEVDIGLRAQHRFWVRHDYLNAELGGEVRMVTREGQLGLTGSFEVIRGTFAFNGRDFKITEGKIHFPASVKLSPVLQVKAEARLGEYQVKVETGGTIDHLAINLSSNPFLRQEEILALVTTGNPRNAIAGGDTGKVGGQLLLDYQKSQVFGGVRRSIQDSLKLDDLTFDTGLSADSSRKEQTLRVGKYVGDKLYVTYTMKKTEDTEKVNRMEFDYRINKKTNFTLEDSSDRGTTFGIKVKQNF